VVLTAEDIGNPPNGKTPSKSAVHALQYWCNNRADFFKGMLGEQKKQTTKDTTTAPAEDLDDLDDTRALLREALQ